MGCDKYGALLHGYADGELDAANIIELEEHLTFCRPCHDDLARLQQVRETIAGAGIKYKAPSHLRSKIQNRSHQKFRQSTPQWVTWGLSGALAASVALLLISPQSAPVPMEHELVESHVRSLLADHLIDIGTSNEHVIRPWFNGRIDFAPRVPELKTYGYDLIGGRLDYVGDKVVPAIVYRRGRHAINLYAWPQAPAQTKFVSSKGYSVIEWSEGNLRYAAVTDMGSVDLKSFRKAFERSAQTDGGSH